MSAFDTAWALLKAPLDFDSIRDLGDVESGGSPYRTLEAQFIDPKTEERLKAMARINDDGIGVGRIYDNQYEDEARARHILAPTSTVRSNMAVYPYSIGTSQGYRQRGYQEAIFQLVAHLLEKKGMEYWEPPSSFKTGDGHMFAERMKEKFAGDERLRNVMGGGTRWE